MRTRIHSVIFIVFLSILLMTISVFASGQIEIFEPAEQEKEETIAESAEAFINSDEAEVFLDVPKEEDILLESLTEAEISMKEDVLTEEESDLDYALFTSENA